MKTKIIPFDLETAKKIQAGEIKGRIVTSLDNVEMEILTFNSFDKEYPIIARYKDIEEMGVELFEYHIDGKTNPDGISFWFDLNIELPEEAPKHEFKPFEKVLVKPYDMSESMEDVNCWRVDVFSHIDKYTGDYVCIGGLANPKYTLPYEGHENLVGTTDKPKED